jgi:hypothetical protein
MTGYEFYLSQEGVAFGDPVYLSDKSLRRTGLLPSSSYHWQVVAIQSDGKRNASTEFDFTTKADTHLNRIMPEDFVYLGAFLTPEWIPGTPDRESWEWGGMALAYDSEGDPSTQADAFPGSLYGAGHDVWNDISEISIPGPVFSEAKDIDGLPIAQTLQPFTDVKSTLFPWVEEMPRVGIEILQPQSAQTSRKLYLCWGTHLQDDDRNTHMWCETNLSDPKPQGAWKIEGLNPYNGNDYLFEIPAEWAQHYTPNLLLATGRYRDGGWSGFGPTLAAIGPWNEGNPPPDGTLLPSTILLKYSDYYDGEPDPWYEMNGYAHSDEWSGGAWLTAGEKSAVVFVGTKGIGNTWYGNPDGPCLDCENRGWWSDRFEGWLLFYDPEELAKVASGIFEPWEPQPYAHLNVDEYLYYVDSDQEKYHLGACAYDRQNQLFYVFESGRGDLERTLVHVWRIEAEP